MFGLADPTHWGPSTTVLLGDGAHLHFAEPPGVSDIRMQHYAFRVSESHFDGIYTRVLEIGLEHWADPQRTLPDQINTNHGGCGSDFLDATGHYLEIVTRSEVEWEDGRLIAGHAH